MHVETVQIKEARNSPVGRPPRRRSTKFGLETFILKLNYVYCSVYIPPYHLIQEHPLAELLVLCVRHVTDIFKKIVIPCIPQGCRYQPNLLLLEESLSDSQHYLKVALRISKPIF